MPGNAWDGGNRSQTTFNFWLFQHIVFFCLSDLAAEHCLPGADCSLMPAGEVLQGERDALLKLIQSMRDEYEATLRNKEEQEAELRGLKVKLRLWATIAA